MAIGTGERRGRLRIFLSVGLLGLLAVALLAFASREQGGNGEGRAKAAPVEEGFQPTETQWKNLRIEPARHASFSTKLETEGKIAINDYKAAPVFSPYSGRVTRVFAEAGAAVAQGQPLFAIEASEFVQAQNDLTTAINARNKARAQHKLTEINEARQRDLFNARAAAKRDYEQAQADFAAAVNDLKTAEIGIDTVRKRLRILGKSDREIEALTTDGAQINPEAVVQAPISGTVIARKVSPGQYIQSGASDPVFTIGDLSTVWLVAGLRESDVPRVRLGAPLTVRVLALPDRPLEAKIVYIASSIDPASRRLPIRAEIENPGFVLKPEMFASFTIVSAAEEMGVAVPQSAIVYEGAEAHVWVTGKNRSIASRAIKTGRSVGSLIEVTSGLQAGEDVVTGGALFIDRAMQPKSSALLAGAPERHG